MWALLCSSLSSDFQVLSHVTMPLWIKKWRLWAPSGVFPELACQYLHCSRMNGPRLGGAHRWIRFSKWVLRGIISAPGSWYAAGVLAFVLFVMIRIFKIHVRFEGFIKIVRASFFFFFLVACQCGGIVREWMEWRMPTLERLDIMTVHFRGPIALLLLLLLWFFFEDFQRVVWPTGPVLYARGELGLWNIVSQGNVTATTLFNSRGRHLSPSQGLVLELVPWLYVQSQEIRCHRRFSNIT